MMRSFLAQFVAADLFALVSVGALIPCPFLKANAHCCPRPLPFFMTERKIGIAEATLESWFPPPVGLVVSARGCGVFPGKPDGSDGFALLRPMRAEPGADAGIP